MAFPDSNDVQHNSDESSDSDVSPKGCILNLDKIGSAPAKYITPGKKYPCPSKIHRDEYELEEDEELDDLKK